MEHEDEIIHISRKRLIQLRQESYEEGAQTIKDFIIDALTTDGGHHKQWYLEQLLIKLGFDINQVKKEELEKEREWDEGIPP